MAAAAVLANYGSGAAQLRSPAGSSTAPCPLRVRPVRNSNPVRPASATEAMTVMATATARRRPRRFFGRRRPTRLPTRAVRPAAAAASGLPPSSNSYSPATGSVYSQPAATALGAERHEPLSVQRCGSAGQFRFGRAGLSAWQHEDLGRFLAAEHQQPVAVVDGQQFQQFGSRSRRLCKPPTRN